MAPEGQVKSDPRRALPSVDRLCRDVRSERPELPEWAVARAARELLARERERLSGGSQTPAPALVARTADRAAALCAPRPVRVVNATGVVLHTNLGRAPLAPGAAAAAAACEAALAVNNNAAALLLALDTLARGREVIVSRGELVEIGGSFRIPEIVERAGVRLVEVGATNRTHRRDVERAIGPDTALLLKVHRSNFEMRGFVAEVELPELVEIGRARGIPVVEDLGSGTLAAIPGLPAEASAPARLRMGPDLVCFSGDKLLGGPQAGLLLGSATRIAQLRANPLARALRLDKLSLAALDWTVSAYLEGRAERDLPVLRQLCAPVAELERRARRLAERLAKVAGDAATVEARPDRTAVGGGSLPGFELETWTVTLEPRIGAERGAALMRRAPVPVLARVQNGRVVLDVRTLLPDDESALEVAVEGCLRGASLIGAGPSRRMDGPSRC
jgi:L-seryl-tRNA(Ser) seleniumtransferase